MMTANRKRILCGWAIGLMGLLALPVLGAEYFVATNGAHTTFTNWATAATNIQAALNVAADNDTIWVTNGTYTGTSSNSVVALTNRTLRSVNGYPYTFIDGNNVRRCILVEGNNALVYGFTITNGNSTSPNTGGTAGGGVRIVSGSGTIQNCLIIGCTAGPSGQGGGVMAYGSCTIRNCIITVNRTDYMGGGVSSYYGGTVENCLIFNNSASNANAGASQGGGVWIRASGAVRNCTIVSNYASGTGGGLNADFSDSAGSVQNCIIRSNRTYAAGDDMWNGSTNVTFTNCCIEYSSGAGGYGRSGTNNISSNPQFVDFAGGNFRLTANSPCINAGANNQSWMTNSVDLDGRTRVRYGTVDMGAYERINEGMVYICR